jgi:hypothetical protein
MTQQSFPQFSAVFEVLIKFLRQFCRLDYFTPSMWFWENLESPFWTDEKQVATLISHINPKILKWQLALETKFENRSIYNKRKLKYNIFLNFWWIFRAKLFEISNILWSFSKKLTNNFRVGKALSVATPYGACLAKTRLFASDHGRWYLIR